MVNTLSMTVRQRDDASAVRLTGVIDESNRLGDLVEQVETRTAVINLAGVERINSRGSRDWIDWLAALDAKGIQPVLVACSPAIVAQLNLVKTFVGHAQVKSFYAPYRCACGATQRVLVQLDELDEANREQPPCTCETCAAPMTFDGDAKTYFAFVEHVARCRSSQQDITTSSPDLARGSSAGVAKSRTQSRTKLRSSSPVLARASLSSFPALDADVNAEQRASLREIVSPQPKPRSERPYLFVIVGLLACALLLLGYLFAI